MAYSSKSLRTGAKLCQPIKNNWPWALVTVVKKWSPDLMDKHFSIKLTTGTQGHLGHLVYVRVRVGTYK